MINGHPSTSQELLLDTPTGPIGMGEPFFPGSLRKSKIRIAPILSSKGSGPCEAVPVLAGTRVHCTQHAPRIRAHARNACVLGGCNAAWMRRHDRGKMAPSWPFQQLFLFIQKLKSNLYWRAGFARIESIPGWNFWMLGTSRGSHLLRGKGPD